MGSKVSLKSPLNSYFLSDSFPDVFVDNLGIILMRAMSSSVDNLHGKPDRETEVTSQLTRGCSGRGLPPDKLSWLRHEVETDLRVEVTNDQESLHRTLLGLAGSEVSEGKVSVVIDGPLPVHSPGESELVRLLVMSQWEREREGWSGYNVTLSTWE